LRSGGVSLLGALLLGAGAGDPPAGSYFDVARRYASGERAAAVAEVGRFTQAELVAVLAALRAQAEAASCVGCAAATAPPLRAIVMLHTDRDEVEGRPAEMTGELSPTCGVRRHASFAERVLAYMQDDAPGRDFARRWYLAMALRGLEETCLADGEAWARAGLKWFPRDAGLLFAHGALQERVAASASLTPQLSSILPREREAIFALLQERRVRFDGAREAFEGAVAADPRMADARLHLGRTLLHLERFDDARKVLEAVATEAGVKAETVYLARLFLGRVHEARGRLDAAAQEYEAAVALDPSAQSAAVALSYVRQARGEAEEARAVLERALHEAKRRRLPDPFWAYPLGRAAEQKEMFARLRQEAST
jgi:tetratricopeptide (TPR) repeat protein